MERQPLGILDRTPRIDLLLTDIVLPGGVAGPELAERARRLRPGTKVLYMSGYASKAVQEGDADGRRGDNSQQAVPQEPTD